MTRPGIEPQSPGPLTNSLLTRPIIILHFLCPPAFKCFPSFYTILLENMSCWFFNQRNPSMLSFFFPNSAINLDQSVDSVLCGGTIVFVAASHQTRLDTRSKARRPIKVGIKGRGWSGRSRDSNPACLCCSSAHLVQCEPDEASSFTNPNVGPGTYASLRLKLDAWSSAVQRGQKCSSPTRRLPSRSWGLIRSRVCSWFRAPIRHESQTAQLKSRGARLFVVEPYWDSRGVVVMVVGNRHDDMSSNPGWGWLHFV